MVLDDKSSRLCDYGFQFRNWPGDGEAAAEQMGISHAVIVPANSRTVIIGGQVGIDSNGEVPEKLEDEVRVAFEHVEASLRAAGLGDDAWEHVYKINTFEVSTPDLMEVVIKQAKALLKGTRPAWTGVSVNGLFLPTLHLEITVEAYLPS